MSQLRKPSSTAVQQKQEKENNKYHSTDISYKQALKWQQSKYALFLDGRTLEEYYRGHIEGAISAFHRDVHENSVVLALGRDTRIVTYCNNINCPIGHILRDKLVTMGFSNVYVFAGGIREWRANGKSLKRSGLYSN
tara:strand:+ start:104 stop:514 length:411 start_codon:yes stop_codon:yes gene_type:complete